MKFIFPQNYKFNKKILGLIDYQTAILNTIWGGIVFLIINSIAFFILLIIPPKLYFKIYDKTKVNFL